MDCSEFQFKFTIVGESGFFCGVSSFDRFATLISPVSSPFFLVTYVFLLWRALGCLIGSVFTRTG